MDLAPPETLFDELTDFLISSPSAQQIIDFQASERLNLRLHDLLDKNKLDALSSEEENELDTFLKIGHLLTMLKAKVHQKLN